MRISLVIRLFYLVKPLTPRTLQIYFRRIRAKKIFRNIGRKRINNLVKSASPLVKWPNDRKAAVLLTHDVETSDGQNSILDLVKIENEFGMFSCWNFVCKRYTPDIALINRLQETGHEIGIHGVFHDGKLFSSRSIFIERLPAMEFAAKEWQAKGFRSPSLLYDVDLLKALPFSWDSSIPAWDPFQPQPGGCGQYFPYKLTEDCVELPVTMWQDFTLFEELQVKNIDIWKDQIDDIYELGGLINIIVHPDYMNNDRLNLYRELLIYLQSKGNVWFALPNEVVKWILSKE